MNFVIWKFTSKKLFNCTGSNNNGLNKAFRQICSENPVSVKASKNWLKNGKIFIKKETLVQVFPVNFVKFLRTPFYIEHLWWLLLKIVLHVFVKLHHLEQREKKKECSTILKLISPLCNSTWEKAISCCVVSIMLESFVGCRRRFSLSFSCKTSALKCNTYWFKIN